MAFHKDAGDGDIHRLHDQEYADVAARDVDVTWNENSANIGKVVKVTAGPTFYLLLSTGPSPIWLEITTSVSQSLAGALAIGNTSGGSDLVMQTGDMITITDAPVGGTDGANKAYVDAQVGTADTLAEVLGLGNTTGGTDIVVSAGDAIVGTGTLALEPAAGDPAWTMTATGSSLMTLGSIRVLSTPLDVGLFSPSGASHLKVSDSSFLLTDGDNSKGVVYAADYSGNFTDRSLVDKAYVDALAGLHDTLAEVLANGNVTGGTDIVISAGDAIDAIAGTMSLNVSGGTNIWTLSSTASSLLTNGTARILSSIPSIQLLSPDASDRVTVSDGSVAVVSDLTTINGKDWRGPNRVFVTSMADFPAAVGGVITLAPFTKYSGDYNETTLVATDIIRFSEQSRLEDMTLVTSATFETESARDFGIKGCVITYTGTGTLFDMPAMGAIAFCQLSTFIFSAAGTLFGIGSVTPNTAVILENIAAVFLAGGSLGAISNVSLGITTARFLGFGTGLSLADNTGVDIRTVTSVDGGTGTHLTVSGTTQGNVQVAGYGPTIQGVEYAFFFDPATTYNGVVTVSSCTINDPARVFAPTSYDQTTLGFKFLGNANIPDSTANVDLGALNQGGVQTVMTPTSNRVKRLTVTAYSTILSERFGTTVDGNVEYTGTEATTLLFNGSVAGTVVSGTNIDFEFYLMKNDSGLSIESIADDGGGLCRITTNQTHGYTTGDRVWFEDWSIGLAESYAITVVDSVTFDIPRSFTTTSTGTPWKVIEATKIGNRFSSGASKISPMTALVPMIQGDRVTLGVANTTNTTNWGTDDVHFILTKA